MSYRNNHASEPDLQDRPLTPCLPTVRPAARPLPLLHSRIKSIR